ncbi:hypothetical protein ACKWRH_07015 [Bradyrhizobium sp. Pa8]|uniref:hypothetical protein n=1 Tax=Bradyrhizobium sp. Pa8 TaxID=3386552 RepID=UPI00403EFA20
MDKRDLTSFVSLLVIPGASMELYESAIKLATERHFETGWDYAKFFFLGAALLAAIPELFHRLRHVLDAASAALIAAGSFFYSFIVTFIVVARWLFGYGWNVFGLQLVGGLLAVFCLALVIFVLAQDEDERERAERDKKLAEVGGPEAVRKQHLEDALDAAEARAFAKTIMSARA